MLPKEGMRHMSRPVGSERIARAYIEATDVAAIEKVTTNMRDRLLVHLLFHLGCRVSEALALTVNEVNFDNGTVTIQHLKARLNLACPECSSRLGKSHAFCPGYGAKVPKVVTKAMEHRRVRTLPLDNDTLDMLRDYICRGGPVRRSNKVLIFGINRHRAWQIIRECGERAGLSNLVNPETGRTHHMSPHRLRDAFAIHAMRTDDSGDGLRLLQEHLGHQNFNTTARYRKVAGDELKEWYNSLWEEKSGR